MNESEQVSSGGPGDLTASSVQVGEMKHLLRVNRGGVEFQSLNWVTQVRLRCICITRVDQQRAPYEDKLIKRKLNANKP